MADEAQLDAIARANAFAVYNGITTHQTGDGTAEASLEIGPDSLNPYGLLHGGAYYTLADCAAGSACRTDGRKYVTLHGSLDFIRSARAGQVTARARVEHRGRTTCLVSITVDDGAGTVYASGRFTYRITGCMKNCPNGPSLRWDGALHSRADEALIRALVDEGGGRPSP